MAVSTKVIKKRIRSIGNTRKITRAMEMVSAAKMRKTVQAVLATRPYATNAWKMLEHLLGRIDGEVSHPLLTSRPQIKRVACIVITSNRGLCGGFNAQVLSTALRAQADTAIEQSWIVLGKKGADFLARNKKTIAAEFIKSDVVTDASEISALVKMIISDYAAGVYDKVVVAYTDFVSTLIQRPRIKQLLPLERAFDTSLGAVDAASNQAGLTNGNGLEFLFEPSPEKVLEAFLPHVVEIQLYQALLESNASEHSARMMAMKNASRAARDMAEELTLLYNQARQASITSEIAEITGGKAALEQAS